MGAKPSAFWVIQGVGAQSALDAPGILLQASLGYQVPGTYAQYARTA